MLYVYISSPFPTLITTHGGRLWSPHYISYNLDHYLYKIVRFPQWQSAAFHASQSIIIIKAQMSFRKHPPCYWCFLNSFTYEKSAKDNLRLLAVLKTPKLMKSQVKWAWNYQGCKLLHGDQRPSVVREAGLECQVAWNGAPSTTHLWKPSVFQSSRGFEP